VARLVDVSVIGARAGSVGTRGNDRLRSPDRDGPAVDTVRYMGHLYAMDAGFRCGKNSKHLNILYFLPQIRKPL